MDILVAFGPALAGGLLIGLAAATYMWANGRIAGISGMIESLLDPSSEDRLSQVLFLAGLIASSLVYLAFDPAAVLHVDASVPLIVVGGILVGFGSRLGAGCTSGHGVCGLSRFSMRSLVSTLTFMGVAFVAMFIMRHVIGA